MHLQEEKGSVIILLTVGLTFFLGLAALVVDAGLLFASRARLQNVADAAALAGAQELPKSYGQAEQVARAYAQENGALPAEIEVETDPVLNTVKVTVRRQSSLFLARLLGFELADVQAAAMAQSQPVTSATGIVPLAVEQTSFEYGRLYTLKTGAPPQMGAGEFGALSLGGSGASRYEDNLKYGYSGVIRVGEWGDVIDTETGNMSGPTSRGIEYRINQDPSSTFPDFERSSPRLVIVPVYVPAEINNKNQIKRVRVVGFAAFFLKGETASGNDNYVEGYFVESVAVGETSPGQQYYGLSGVKLIR